MDNFQASADANRPSLSAIICTYNRYDLLPDAIQSLLVQNIAREKIEIIVVDNSADATKAADFAKQYAGADNVRYVYQSTPGLSNARNYGAELARAAVVAYIDDDAIAFPTWADEIIATYDKFGDDVAAVGGAVRARWLGPKPNWLTPDLEGFFSILDMGQKYHEVGAGEYVVGCNLSFRRDSILSAGGFSAGLGRCGSVSLLSNDENHILDLIRANGKKVIYAPTAVVEHQIDASRVDANWLRRRIAWQAVSEVLSNPEATAKWAEVTSNRINKLGVLTRRRYLSNLINSRSRVSSSDLSRIYDLIALLLCVGG